MKEKETRVFTLNAVWISYAHTFCAASAFLSALIVGCLLHYRKIVQNEHFGYPIEWFPSVSATIGDRYPERSVYQIFIALTSGPRFLLCILSYILSNSNSNLPFALFVVGVLRTLTCGGWTYVTSTDDHDWHDIFMISYIVLTLPWTILNTVLTPKGTEARKLRFWVGTTFFVTIVPLVYFFIQHKVHHIPGAYTIYAFFEWALIVLDVAFDSITAWDFSGLEINIVDTQNVVKRPTNIEVLANPSSLRKGPSYVGYAVAVFNYFIWWSVVTSQGVLIWYFPLWYMGISGYEALLFAFVAPIVLIIPPIRKLFVKLPQLGYLGTCLGIAAYWVPKPSDRVCVVSAGCGLAAISLATTFTTRSGGLYHGSAFMVGLLLSSVAKMYKWTNNPIWPVMNSTTGGLNAWGLAFSIGSAFLTTLSKSDVGSVASTASASGCVLSSGAALGAAIFALQTWVSDTSLLPIWVWEGYPVRGPTPLPHGLLTLMGVSLGVYVGIARPKLALSYKSTAFGLAGLFVLLTLKHWLAYFGGLALASWVCAIVPSLLEAAGRKKSGQAFTLAFFVYCCSILAETWTVAYAFVPGGPVLRERTWLVMTINTVLLIPGVINARKLAIKQPLKNVIASSASQLVRLTVAGLSVVIALGSLVTVQRLQHVVPAPRHPEEKVLTAGIWCIHFALDNDMWASEKRMMDLIDELDIDVIGFLESDTQRVIGGHRDLTQRMAEELGFYADYGPGPNKHTWGAALLSRFPILNSTHHLTPSPVGELAPAIHATLDVYGELVDVVVFHSGQEEDPEDRRQQTAYVTELLHNTNRPTIQLSYLVTKPKEGNYNTWVSEYSGMKDIDPSDWDRWCEYILYKNIKRTGYARVSRSTITDTELQVGKFVIGETPDYSNTLIGEDQVPAGRQFPAKFRGQGVRGHRYHVFDEPRYFS